MRAIVVYESMFGNTRAVAEAIVDGLTLAADARAVSVLQADQDALDDVDLVVVGGPTHAWSMSRPSTRRGSPLHLADPKADLALEPGADWGPGVREWLDTLPEVRASAAAFDTRLASPVLLTGRASKAIGRQLKRHGLTLVVPPESFLVDRRSHLVPGESERARAWGVRLARLLEPSHHTDTRVPKSEHPST